MPTSVVTTYYLTIVYNSKNLSWRL